MFPFLRKRAASAAAILALTGTLALAASPDRAEATLKYNFGGIEGAASSQKSGDGSKVDNPADMTKRAGGAVCCVKPGSDKAAVTKASECRAAKGRVVAQTQCPRTQHRLPGRTKYPNIVLKRG